MDPIDPSETENSEMNEKIDLQGLMIDLMVLHTKLRFGFNKWSN